MLSLFSSSEQVAGRGHLTCPPAAIFRAIGSVHHRRYRRYPKGSEMPEFTFPAAPAGVSASHRFDERLHNVLFRLRLIRMALRRLDSLPAALVMAMEDADHDSGDWA